MSHTPARCILFLITPNFFFLIDVNECTLGAHSCDANADCNNTAGSYSCQCRTGYSGNGKACAGVYFYILNFFI